HRGVVVTAADVAERRDRERQAEAEAEGDSERSDNVDPDVDRNRDPATAEKEEEKRAERLGSEALPEWMFHVSALPKSGLGGGSAGASGFLRGKRATGLEPATSSLEGWRSTN